MCIFLSADPLGLARRLMLPLPLSPSPPGPKIIPWPWTFVLHPPQNSIIFQVSFSIAIKIDFEPHLGSILASIGIQKQGFCKGEVSKINIFTFSFLTSSELNFSLILAPLVLPKSFKNESRAVTKRFQDRFWSPRRLQEPILEPKVTPMMLSKPYFGP